MFLEAWSRPLTVLHAVLAAVLVGASTHHLLWVLPYLRRRFDRDRRERRMAGITAALFVASFVLGAALYPTYKVRVRVEYLDSTSSVADDVATRRTHSATGGRPPAHTDLSWVGRLFDIKEHHVALGAVAALAVWALSRFAHPRDYPAALPLYFGLTLFTCGTAWAGSVIGLVVASYRHVGGPG